MKRAILLALAIGCGVSGAKAVIVGPGTGTGNTTGSGMSSGWNYVGTVNGASGIYLSNGWVLTAAHVGAITPGATTFSLSGANYVADSAATRLTNGDSSLADLQMFHLAASPNLTALSLASSTPANGTVIYMVGYGRDPRDSTPTYYTTSSTPWTVDANPLTAGAAGFGYGANQVKRWGTNTVDGTAAVDAGYGKTSVLTANFYGSSPSVGLSNYNSNNPGSTGEALLSPGDSGGGVFDANGVLVGMNNYVGSYSGQPSNTAVFGDASDMANISAYRGQILGVVPEPSTLLLLGAVTIAMGVRRTPRRVD